MFVSVKQMPPRVYWNEKVSLAKLAVLRMCGRELEVQAVKREVGDGSWSMLLLFGSQDRKRSARQRFKPSCAPCTFNWHRRCPAVVWLSLLFIAKSSLHSAQDFDQASSNLWLWGTLSDFKTSRLRGNWGEAAFLEICLKVFGDVLRARACESKQFYLSSRLKILESVSV